jgi:hypothetical protein
VDDEEDGKKKKVSEVESDKLIRTKPKKSAAAKGKAKK